MPSGFGAVSITLILMKSAFRLVWEGNLTPYTDGRSLHFIGLQSQGSMAKVQLYQLARMISTPHKTQ